MTRMGTNHLSIAYIAEPLEDIRVIGGYKGLSANDSRDLQPRF